MTKEEAKIILGQVVTWWHDKLHGHPQLEYIAEAAEIILSEPSLPSDLDEAAEEFASNAWLHGGVWHEAQRQTFKAGAEWMAGQGYTKETQVYANRWTDIDEAIVNLGQGESGFKAGDKVVVQIRKKE